MSLPKQIGWKLKENIIIFLLPKYVTIKLFFLLIDIKKDLYICYYILLLFFFTILLNVS